MRPFRVVGLRRRPPPVYLPAYTVPMSDRRACTFAAVRRSTEGTGTGKL